VQLYIHSMSNQQLQLNVQFWFPLKPWYHFVQFWFCLEYNPNYPLEFPVHLLVLLMASNPACTYHIQYKSYYHYYNWSKISTLIVWILFPIYINTLICLGRTYNIQLYTWHLMGYSNLKFLCSKNLLCIWHCLRHKNCTPRKLNNHTMYRSVQTKISLNYTCWDKISEFVIVWIRSFSSCRF